MTIEWMLAKYVPDMQRNEPVNIGLILIHGDQVLCKFLGETQNGSIDGKRVRSRFASVDAYKMWVEYWKRLADQKGEIVKLGEARRSSDNYYLEKSGAYLSGAPKGPGEALLAELFDLLVDRDESSSPDVLRLSETTIRRLPMAKDIERDSEVIVKHGGVEDELRFHYRYNNGRPHLMQRVSLTSDPRSWDRVHSTAWSFEKVLGSDDAILRKSLCIALVKSSPASEGATRRQLNQLERLATIVDVGNTDIAWGRLSELLVK